MEPKPTYNLKPTLDQILLELVNKEIRDHVTLERGLTIAFTPAALNSGRCRLCLSRKKQRPSAKEAETVIRHLGLALVKLGRDFGIVTSEAATAVNGQPCIIIEWVELIQGSLFDLSPNTYH